MKFELNKGVVTLTSETPEEALTLFRVAVKTTDVFAPQLRKHKKHNFKKSCPECGKQFKGNRGLAGHRMVVHKWRSPNYERNKEYQRRYLEKKKKAFSDIWK